MTVTLNDTVGQIATDHPLATRVFARHGIDFCCGGGKPLDEACTAKSLDAAAVLAEIEDELSKASARNEQSWAGAPPTDLIKHILAAYHRPLDEELPRLEGMARKVLDVHGEKDPERFAGIVQVFAALRAELTDHMAKEEQILFPMIERGEGAMAGGPIAVMREEHDGAGNALRRLRELTNDYKAPEEACTTWRALWHGLEAFEQAIHEHIHLENNILFPAVLDA